LIFPTSGSTGVDSTIAISSACTVLGVTVDVDITHTDTTDVTVALTAPNGTTNVTLHYYANTTNIVGNYPLTLTPYGNLSNFNGLSGQGNWILNATDHYTGYGTGTLNRWGINLICQ
jgi:subtilisin-like proprotein convertase family protein